MDEAEVRRILDVALRFGQLLLGCHVSTADVASTIVSVTTAYGLPTTQVNITANSIVVSVPRGVPGAPVTAMHVVMARSLDYTRLQTATDFARHVADTTPEPGWVQQQLDALELTGHGYASWVSTVASGVMAGAFSLLIGGGALVAMVATTTTMLIDRIGRILEGWHVPLLFRQVVGALLAASIVIGLEATGRLPTGVTPSLVVAANIVALLSGLSAVISVQDIIAGYQLTASARIIDIVFSSVGILVGITIAVRVGEAVGPEVHVSGDIPVSFIGLPVRVLAGAVGAAAAAVAGYAPRRAALAAGAAGAAGSLIFFGLQFAGASNIESSFVAAVAIGLAGAIGARGVRVPPLVIVVAGIVPLVPGMALCRGVIELVHNHPASGLSSLGMAVGTALALGAGVSAGPLLIPSIRRELDRS